MEVETGLGLKWTGHPLYDAGLASLMVFNEKDKPEELTEADFENFAKLAEKLYFASDMVSTISVLFTLNNFMNPSYSLETKREKTGEVLRSYQKAALDELKCTYSRQPAATIAARDLIPLLTGRDAVNFSPYGQTGLPVSGHTLVILQALTLAALRSQGKALIVVADDPQVTLAIIRKWQPEILSRAQISDMKGDQIRSPQSRIIKALVELEGQRAQDEDAPPCGITAYHFSNSGQGPSINIYYLPAMVTRFIRLAQNKRYGLAWSYITNRGWLRPKPPKGSTAAAPDSVPNEEAQRSWQNHFYDALFQLPGNGPYVVRRYFGRNLKAVVQSGKPAENENLCHNIWLLTELFLQEVLNMDKERIKAIRELADALASEVADQNDHRLFNRLTIQIRNYSELRNQIIKFKKQQLIRGKGPIPDFETFLFIFEEGEEETVRADWRLAWDLVLIRFFDELYRRRWGGLTPEILQESEQEQDDNNNE